MDINILVIGIIIVSLLISLSFHEAMHAFVAHALGDSTAEEEGRLTLNPLVHIDLFTTILLPALLLIAGLPPILAAKPVPFNPNRVKFQEFGAAMVGLAGPLSNLLLAAITAFIITTVQPLAGSTSFVVLMTFLQVNVGVFIFNMLPIPPLDGSRVLYAFAPESVQRVMEQIESFGILIILGAFFLLLPVLGPILRDMNQAVISFLL